MNTQEELNLIQTQPVAIHLPDQGLLKISGPDAKKFLQGQVTCNLDEVTAEHSQHGAHCTPQGRVVFLFRLFFSKESYYFFLPKSMIPLALNALKKYAVFFKVQLEDVSLTVPFYGRLQHPETSLAYAISDTRYLIMDSTPEPTLPVVSQNVWHYLDIIAGLPSVYPETTEKFLPHDLNMHLIHGINFNKGCYTGQEIIARMQHRGTLKNHMYRAKITSRTRPAPGADVFCEGKTGPEASGIIVAVCEEGYNNYQVLLVAGEKQVQASPFFLEPNSLLTFLDLPYQYA